jgi:hypothetical protein
MIEKDDFRDLRQGGLSANTIYGNSIYSVLVDISHMVMMMILDGP